MANIKDLTIGQLVFSAINHKLIDCRAVKVELTTYCVKEINLDEKWIMAAVNGGRIEKFKEIEIKQWKTERPTSGPVSQ